MPPKTIIRPIIGLFFIILLSACSNTPSQGDIYDPYEPANRAVHRFNVAVDRNLFRPTAKAYGQVVPEPIKKGLHNFASNLNLPGDAVNGALQGNSERFIKNTFRFAINSTIGLAGFFDPASVMGLTHEKTDFGETLYVWGVGEGPYIELPIFGPSNARDTAGFVVDLMYNPFKRIVPNSNGVYELTAEVASKLYERDKYSAVIDSMLDESADSYAQVRLLSTQNRHYELGQTGTNGKDDFIDPYEE